MEIVVEGSTLYNGDCLVIMNSMNKCSVDSIVTDPPYHLTSIVERFGKEGSAPAKFGTDGAFARASKGFMGKEWDGGDIAFQVDTWRKCLELLKPGGHLVIGLTESLHGEVPEYKFLGNSIYQYQYGPIVQKN